MKAGRKMLSNRQSNAHFSLASVREYSDLYKEARADFQAKKEEKSSLDELYEARRDVQRQIDRLIAVRKFYGLDDEQQERLDMLFGLRNLINKDPRLKQKAKAPKEDKAKNAFLNEVYDLYLCDTRFLPNEVKDFVSKNKAFIKDMKVVGNNGKAFAFVKCPDTVEFHWVEL